MVKAKPETESPGKGMQQAKEYFEILGLKFAYVANGHRSLDFDYQTEREPKN